MNIASLIGLILIPVVFFATIFLSFSNPLVLIDFRSTLIVVGGTATSCLISFPLKKIATMFRIFIRSTFSNQGTELNDLLNQIKSLSVASRKGKSSFELCLKELKDPFLKEGGEILFWSEENIKDEELRDLLETRVATQHERNRADAKIFKTISQFPPAFGLMGTTLGMIALLQDLGKEGGSSLGISMAIALITTLYGIAVANFFFIPMSENLMNFSEMDHLRRRMIAESLMLMHEGKPPSYVEEYARSYIAPQYRVNKRSS